MRGILKRLGMRRECAHKHRARPNTAASPAKRSGRGGLYLGIAVLSAALWLLPGCRSQHAPASMEVMEILANLDYAAEELTDYGEESPILRGILSEAEDRKVEWFLADSKENAVAFFQWNRDQAAEKKEGLDAESAFGFGSYQRYTLETADDYYYIARWSDTVLFASSAKASAETLKRDVKELGY